MKEEQFEAGRTIDETLHRLGHSKFRDRQEEAIRHLLAGRDTLVVLPTGVGKSLIYEIAALHLPGITLVISPLIALMQDQFDKLEEQDVPATFINSGLSEHEQAERLERMSRGEYKIVYVTPERLRQHSFHEQVAPLEISLLAVDEAHSVSEWGHDFRPEYMHIAEFRRFIGNPVTVALTATATSRVQDEIIRLLQLKDVRRVRSSVDRPNIRLAVEVVPGEKADEEKLAAIGEIFEERRKRAAIVYVGTRKNAEVVADYLREQVGIEAEHYHAGLAPGRRTEVQEAFIDGALPVVVATNAFGMGIDRPDVRLIVHHTMPGSLDAYYQEIGRAGRDGRPAEAILLYERTDRNLHEHFIRQAEVDYDKLKQLYETLVEESQEAGGKPQLTVRNNKRMGLERLAEAGVIEQNELDGLDQEISLKPWDADAIKAEVARVKAFNERQEAQLEEMIQYAENTLHCRRGEILQHFGEHVPDEPRAGCCDICEAKLEVAEFVTEIEEEAENGQEPEPDEPPPPLTETILACVRQFDNLRTHPQMVDLLHGDEKGYNRFHDSDYHGRLSAYGRDEINAEITRLIHAGTLKVSKLETLSVAGG